MNVRYAAALAGGAVALLAGAAHADDFQPKAAGLLMLNVRVTDVIPEGNDNINLTATGAATGLKAKATSDVMPTIGLSYFFTDNIAGEVIVGTTQHTIRAVQPGSSTDVYNTWVLPPVIAVQYHFLPKSRFSPYVGAGVNAMLFYSGQNKNGFSVKVPDGVGAALQAGFDYAIKGKWSLNMDVKQVFFQTKATVDNDTYNTRVNLNPVVASVGVGYKF